jgi:hypothetical protein
VPELDGHMPYLFSIIQPLSVSRQKELDIRVTAYPANAYNDELAQSPRW